MRMYDIIHKKREGLCLTREELAYFVKGYSNGDIPDYQASALMMAVYFKGMSKEETTNLTLLMAESGDMVDLSEIKGIKVDKHSTGGVGDKTSLIIGPIAAACGVKIAKMSGRGLGHTGGTVDKLESIPGLRTDLNREEFFSAVNRTGLAIIGQSGNLCPADKKLYALRDVTATVESIPLIASSIMSKKLAAGSDRILLDVKTGIGAFMKTQEDSEALAKAMVEIGCSAGRRTIALITDMDRPLGRCIGNSLEIMEAVDTLKGNGPGDLTELCIELAANMILLGEEGKSLEQARSLARNAVENGSALNKLRDMAAAQGGDSRYITGEKVLPLAPVCHSLKAPASGYINRLNAESCGIAAIVLGAGRETIKDTIDYGAGVVLKRSIGDMVKEGEEIALLYTSKAEKAKEAQEIILSALSISEKRPEDRPLIKKRIELS